MTGVTGAGEFPAVAGRTAGSHYALQVAATGPAFAWIHARSWRGGPSRLETRATGLAVVAGDAPGDRDAVHDGMTGQLFPAGNAESLSQAIAFLPRERNFLKSFATATTHAIGKDHHIGSAAAQLGQILNGLGGPGS